MDKALFRTLIRGSKFDRKRFAEDIEHFEKGKPSQNSAPQLGKGPVLTTASKLDFFGTKANSINNGNSTQEANTKTNNNDSDEDENKIDDEEERNDSSDEDSSDNEGSKSVEDGSGDDESREDDADAVQMLGNKEFLEKKELDDERSKQKSEQNKKKKQMTQLKKRLKKLRDEHKIRINGTDVPAPIETFEQLATEYNFKNYILKNIQEAGYAKPTPIQMQVIPILMLGRELLASAPTGSGKTAAFILPILAFLNKPAKEGFRAVVVSPTRELAEQIHREFLKLSKGKNWNINLITGGATNAKLRNRLQSKNQDILVATPSRLCQLIDEGAISLDNVQRLIFDEGDKLFEMGFIKQADKIIAACTHPKIQRSLFSATMPEGVEEMARTILRDPIRVTIGARNTPTELVDQKLQFVGTEEGKLIALRQIFQQGIKPPILIFVQTIERAQQLFRELVYDGLNVDVIHGERTPAQRHNIVNNFRIGKIWVLICTNLLARGIDFKGVSCVINFDFPESITSYIHRIGRTGRAGRAGRAITFFTHEDSDQVRGIAHAMKASGCDVPEWMLNSKKMIPEQKRLLERRPRLRPTISTDPQTKLKDEKKRQRLEPAYKKEEMDIIKNKKKKIEKWKQEQRSGQLSLLMDDDM